MKETTNNETKKANKLYVVSEEQEQQNLFRWIEMQQCVMPELRLLFHIPNGGLRTKSQAKRFKAAGVKAGVPDLFLPVARNGHHGLFIEMKSDRGFASARQREWLANLQEQGYKAIVCHGWIEASFALAEYLGVELKYN